MGSPATAKTTSRRARGLRSLGFALSCLILTGAPGASAADPALSTPLQSRDLDPAAYAESVDGAEKPIAAGAPKDVLWTADTRPHYSGVAFGNSRTPGPRHLRVGFAKAVPAGAVLARGNVRVSALKPGAAYPGNLADDAQWHPAHRLKSNQATADPPGRDDFALWALPPGTTTRALRFTHTAELTDRTYAGWVGGAALLPARVANVAAQAVVAASANDHRGDKLVNGKGDSWGTWDNAPDAARPTVSPEHPEWVLLAWPAPVKLRGLCAIGAGFREADVQAYTGPADRHPRDAAESDWRTITKATGLENGYPLALWPNWIDFGAPVEARAVRLRITARSTEQHPHLKGRTMDGRRVWLDELMALADLGNANVETAIIVAPPTSRDRPPIAVRFVLPEPALVTLVIETAQGQRVRNLVSETPFPAGANTAWWDGTDDLGRDLEAAKHGIYRIPARFVEAGTYRVRGLYHKPIDLRYEFALYNAGNPPWLTADGTGGWLTNHSGPGSVAFVPAYPDKNAGKAVPAIAIGSYVSEGGSGLAWVDLDGKKLAGQNWVGGTWTGAQYLAHDAGKSPVDDHYAYVGSVWRAEGVNKKNKSADAEVRITALTTGGDKPVLKHTFTPPPARQAELGDATSGKHLGGLAARDGVIAFSLPGLDRLVFAAGKTGKVIGETPLPSARGVAFDTQGRLLALSGKRLVRFATPATPGIEPTKFPAPEVLTENLEEPLGLTTDPAGNIYVSDRGNSHQVKVFDPAGKPVRTVGKPGAPKAGPYDPERLTDPHGLAIDADGRLWVAEESLQPKRVSVWTPDGKLHKAFYGPNQYGGGGALDPLDPTRFYYHGMEFKLDWARGTNDLVRVFWRQGHGGDDDGEHAPFKLPRRSGMPEQAIHVAGRQYMTDAFNASPTQGTPHTFVWLMRDGVAVPVAGIGRAIDWDVLKAEPFKSMWPGGADLSKGYWDAKGANQVLFLWTDNNADARVQTDEVTLTKAFIDGLAVAPDLSFVSANFDAKAVRWKPTGFTPAGVPTYDLAKPEVLVEGAQRGPSTGGVQCLPGTDGWTILTTAPQPFSAHGIGGARDGKPAWSYPSLWPGLHASHEAAVPDRPGMLIGTTRLLGPVVRPPGEAGPVFALNSNHGNVYLFTQDGLFVADLFRDMRLGQSWSMPVAQRGMRLNDLTQRDETFYPTIAQAPDGRVYLVAGKEHQCLVRVDGLDTVRRIPPADLTVTANDLARAREHFEKAEAERQKARGTGVLKVVIRDPAKTPAPTIDGKLGDWAGADWAPVDQTGTAAYFNSQTKPYNVSAAVTVAGDRLYVAWRTAGETTLLRNTGENPLAPFKTGGALDVMLGADPAANPNRTAPARGDQRLLITRVKDKSTGGKASKDAPERTLAMLYRAVVPGTKDPVPFSSPARTITIDRVDDVSAQVQFAAADGNYEISIPLSTLGLKLAPGQTIKADLGVLRGDGLQTLRRVYWSNKATNIVADVPSEAELKPGLWGRWEMQ